MKLSVAIATYNEKSTLGRCLQSVVDWVDEIVVVDGGSTDRTREVAKKYHAHVYTYENPPIFHINKQRAIDKCRGDWILQLDADEIVSSELKEKVLAIIEKKSDINGYWIPRKNYFLGRFLTKGGQYPDYTMRLYRRGKGRLPCKSVHEQAEVEGKVGYLTQPLLHYADPTLGRYLLRFDRYTNLISQELHGAGTPKNLWTFFSFCIVKPLLWFFKTYIRHKGFVDSWQGFLFSFFSSLRFPVAFIKYLKGRYEKNKSSSY